MPGKLTTHVLDISRGRPAVGMRLELRRVDREGSIATSVKTVITNSDGRTDKPLLEGAELDVGTYELVFHVGDYFVKQHGETDRPLFLDFVPVRFGIADASANYHVPLLVSPWTYSTYRGS
jgi:5-hydroxyisourate hydrolase